MSSKMTGKKEKTPARGRRFFFVPTGCWGLYERRNFARGNPCNHMNFHYFNTDSGWLHLSALFVLSVCNFMHNGLPLLHTREEPPSKFKYSDDH